MKTYFSLMLMVVMLAACSEAKQETKENKNLLPTNLVSNPYSAEGLDTTAFNNLPTMDFTDTLHDFGWLDEGEKATHTFGFKNNGKTPLIISNANGSCGCAIADFPKDPVAPGATGEINVEFNSVGKQGHQEKSVSITTNSTRSVHLLYIKADVRAANK